MQPGAPSDNTTMGDVLADLAAEGYTGDLFAKPDATVLCPVCRTTSPAGAFEIGTERRLEGASDPDDEQVLIGATCPACEGRGVLTLQYGPASSEDDAAVLTALQR